MVFVTSDLHGCSPEAFQQLLTRAGFTDGDYLFILGDVIDRGEHGAELLLWLTEQPNIQLILGNHEGMLLSCRFLFEEATEETAEKITPRDMELFRTWMYNGGEPTMKGLNRILKQDPELFQGIMEYLEDAPLYEQLQVGGKQYILVHSGLGNFTPEKALEDYTPGELLWTRPELGTRYFPDATVIFGHTPTELYGEEYKGRVVKTDTWICIDTGAAYGGSPMVLRLGDERVYYWKQLGEENLSE